MANVKYRGKRFLLFYCILISFIILVFMISFFIGRRLLDGEVNVKSPGYANIVKYDPHREGGHLLPNVNMLVQGERLGQGVKVITNSKGFRNDYEFEYTLHKNRFRVLFLGDSFVDGHRTDQKHTIGYILEDLLNAKNRTDDYNNFEVMISGHNNPANTWYYYQEHGWKYHPNLVILGVTLGNDITWHNYKTGVLPDRYVDGSLYLKLAPILRQSGSRKEDLLLPYDAYLPNEDFWEFLQDIEFRIRYKLSQKWYMFGYTVPPAIRPKHNTKRHVHAADFHVSLGLFYMPVMTEIEEMYSDFEEVLMGMSKRIEKDRTTSFLVVLFPTRIQVSQKDWKLLKRFYSLDKRKFDLTYPNRRITMFLKKHDINYLDLRPTFKQHIEKYGKPLYRSRGDMHFNERGQELAGKAIAEKVISLINENGGG